VAAGGSFSRNSTVDRIGRIARIQGVRQSLNTRYVALSCQSCNPVSLQLQWSFQQKEHCRQDDRIQGARQSTHTDEGSRNPVDPAILSPAGAPLGSVSEPHRGFDWFDYAVGVKALRYRGRPGLTGTGWKRLHRERSRYREGDGHDGAPSRSCQRAACVRLGSAPFAAQARPFADRALPDGGAPMQRRAVRPIPGS
jgi:hypothetical protein